MNEKNQHGGNIYKKARELGIAEQDILDFSANINPLGPPPGIREALIASLDDIMNYPDPDCHDLSEAIGRSHGVSPDMVVCGNGGADLLYRMAFGLRPGTVLLPAPAFIEYGEALAAAGCRTDYYRMGEDLVIGEDILDQVNEETDLIILCNPNNPTGLLTERDLILKLLDRARTAGARLMVDECFLDLCRGEGDYTLIPYLDKYRNLIILKSFTKLYAIPGIRLGYMLSADPGVTGALKRAGQAWPVSGPAQKAGIAALSLPDYKSEVLEKVQKELVYMKEKLSGLPIRLYDGKANYLFFRTPGIRDLDRRLEKEGILIRSCSNYENLGEDCWRVAVRMHEENRKLIRVLEEALRFPGES